LRELGCSGAATKPTELAAGLYRWVVPHPDWRSDAEPGEASDWPQLVGCVLYQGPEASTLIDPLLPVRGRDSFLGWLDDRVAGRRVSILTTIRWHRRDRKELAERYCDHSGRAWNAVPSGVVPKPLRGGGETVLWLPDVATLVFGDSLVGLHDGTVEVCPESWLKDEQVDRAGLAGLMRALIELPVQRLLVSHGRPVLQDGRAELARAIRRARGE
jgi:hypothetical protein